MSQPTSLITGITGQDGSYLAELLIDKGHRVIGLTRRCSTNNTERLKGVLDSPYFILEEGDLTDAFSLSSIVKKYKPDYFYNLAAQSHVGTSFEQPKYTWEVDAVGPLNLLEAIRRESPATKFYQASTSELFGSEYDIDGQGKFYQDEKTCMYPNSPYGVAKMAAHDLVRIYRDAYGIFGCCGILFNHESPRRGENFITRKVTKYVGKLDRWKNKPKSMHIDYLEAENRWEEAYQEGLNIAVKNAISIIEERKTPPKLKLGNLDASRDWGHAKDMVRGMVLMMEQEIPQDFVLATGESHSIRELLEVAFGEIGENWEDWVEVDPAFFRPCEVPYLCGRADRAKRRLGWEPEISFEELIKEMVREDIKDNIIITGYGYDIPSTDRSWQTKSESVKWDDDLKKWVVV